MIIVIMTMMIMLMTNIMKMITMMTTIMAMTIKMTMLMAMSKTTTIIINFHEGPRQKFPLQYQYNIKLASDEEKEKYQLGDY